MKNTKITQYKILSGVILCQLTLLYFLFTGTIMQWSISFFIYFLMMGLGVSLLNHRILAHKSVNVENKFFRHFLLFLSTIMLQGSTLAWVGMHREHHAYSDTDKDPHSPVTLGFWKSYWLSMMHTPNIRFVKDLMREKTIQWYHNNYWKINISYSIVLFILFGFEGMIIGHLVPAALTWHGVSVVNAVSHTQVPVPKIIGYRNFETNEYSKNIPLAGYLTFGEAWHNNHHGDPSNPSFKLKWWEWDLVGQIALLIKKTNNKVNS